jgi:hypothetical protein
MILQGQDELTYLYIKTDRVTTGVGDKALFHLKSQHLTTLNVPGCREITSEGKL